MVYVDSSRPEVVDGFTRKTFTAMIEGIRVSAVSAGLIEPESFDAGVHDLHRTTEADGMFCYTFFKGVGDKRSSVPLRRGIWQRTMAQAEGSLKVLTWHWIVLF